MAKSTVTTATVRRGFSPRRFFGDITAELKKVVWLPPREAAYLTGVVIIVTVIAGVALGFLDMGFTNLVNNIFLGG
ncbi:MAG: preprotein translocase subunit SecE [Dehalococcoidales bacterium]|jgi:preprotein translocase SecE subunit|nr:preprotein translocase subunit SecE [Dehalococcoidales bacterium]